MAKPVHRLAARRPRGAAKGQGMTYTPDHGGLGELLVSPDMESAMRQLAAKVMARAISTAPDAAPYGTGYVSSFELDSGVRPGKTPRAFGRVKNTSGHARSEERRVGKERRCRGSA